MKTIAILDPWATGHHPMYMRTMTLAFLELGHRVLAICPSAPELSAWIMVRRPDLIRNLSTFEVSAPPSSRLSNPILRRAASGLKAWNHARRSIRQALKEENPRASGS